MTLRALLITAALPLIAISQVDSVHAHDEPTMQADASSKALIDFERLMDDVRTADLAGDPIAAGQEGDKDALTRLPNVSQAAELANNLREQGYIARLRDISRDALPTDEDRLNYDLFDFVLEQRVMTDPYDTARIPFTNDSGFFNSFSYISRQTTFKTAGDYEAYAKRLRALEPFFEQHKTNMRRGITTGYTASDEIMPGITKAVKALAETSAEDHAFYAPFKTMPDTISKSEQTRLRALGMAAMAEAVLPAYKSLHRFLKDEYNPYARTSPGIGTTAEGRALYATLTRYFTTLDLTPDEVHNIGLSEVKRIRAEMDAVIEESGFEGTFQEFLTFLRTDEQFYAKTETELLSYAALLAKRADGAMPRFFGKLPRLSYGVIPVPAEIAPNYTTGRYWSGNLKTGLAGNYVVNTYDLPQRPLYNLPALTLHEGVPGHHHQISLSQELENVPEFRQGLYPNAFGEGWGLYTEKLGVEMDMYKTPYDNFGRLTYEMWRACRLVVDTGMHWKGWSREKAEACFYENSALSPHNIRTEVERYISWPGQALAYKIGELKIWELRRRAERELGDNFDIRQFHDEVLSDGGVPLGILEAKIDRWIGEQKTTAIDTIAP